MHLLSKSQVAGAMLKVFYQKFQNRKKKLIYKKWEKNLIVRHC